jgi:heme-degrading monooxygenase HmoA
MFEVNVDLSARSGLDEALKSVYRNEFCPAIAQQPGFRETKLLAPRAPRAWTHRLVIVFDREEQQKQWVATELHERV